MMRARLLLPVFFSAFLSIMVSACMPAVGPPASKGADAFPDTLARAFAAMASIHVTPIDQDAFTRAGFRALNLPAPAPASGRITGQRLADAYARTPALQAQGAETVMETFMTAGLAATLPADVRFTTYLTPKQMFSFTRQLSEQAGIGILVAPDPLGLKIIEVRPGGPAARGGLQVGDLIIRVNGKPLLTIQSLEDRVLSLAGRAGGRVQLKIRRGDQDFTLRIARENQTLNDFGQASLQNGIAHIPLRVFDVDAASYVRRSYQRLTRLGPISGLILDLRDNSGGSTGQATAIADLFLPAGTPLYRFAGRGLDHRSRARSTPLVPLELPMVVLINANTASASEAVASALADQGRAVLIGATSFGKGTQQRLVPLPNGGAITLTNAFILRKNDRRLTKLGVTPHICAANVASARTLTRALRTGSQPRIQRQALATTRLSRIDALCPRVAGSAGKDMDLARAVMASPSVYSAALGL